MLPLLITLLPLGALTAEAVPRKGAAIAAAAARPPVRQAADQPVPPQPVTAGPPTTPAAPPEAAQAPQIRVFLDCDACFQDYLQEELTFVDRVRDRTEADVHVLITSSGTGGGGREYTVSLMGAGRFDGVSHTLRTATLRDATEDVVRRQLLNTVRLGLLQYLTRDGVPPELGITVRLGDAQRPSAAAADPWDSWVFSIRAAASFDGEESSRETELGVNLSADRITPDWKITIGSDIEHQTEEFDLDEEDPVKVERRERDLNALVVKGLGEHWSVGAAGEIESSTFENTRLAVEVAPAVEFNVFPYSAYTRRQLRALYAAGVRHLAYYETTLFGETEETRPLHEVSLTYEQREPWGSLNARTEWSQFLHDLSKSRLEAEGELSLRLARGLSVEAQLAASRIRDQISLPSRGATPEEILLRLRQLQSGYEYRFSFGITYSFGSIFSSIVNPRFGQ
jgi:hypothetical protein